MTDSGKRVEAEIEQLRRRCAVLERAIDFQGRKVELQHKKLLSFIKINSMLLADQQLDKVLQDILEAALSILSAGGGSLMLREPGSDTLRICASRGISEEVGRTVRPRIGEGIAGWVAETGKTLLLSESTADPRFRALCVRENVKDALCVPLKANGLILGVLNVRNSMAAGTFDEDDMELLTAFADQAAMAIEVARQKDEVEAIYLDSVTALAEAVDARDTYTAGHSVAVRDWALRLARRIDLEEDRTRELAIGATLHDIGKIGIDDSILRKPGPLTDDEFAQIRTHPIVAVRILESLGARHDIIPMIRHHHERYDGKGYPAGLSKDEIPMEARILAVADSYHAMASVRPYRDALPFEKIVDELQKGRGGQFDPELADEFLACLDEIGLCEETELAARGGDAEAKPAPDTVERAQVAAGAAPDSREAFMEIIGVLSETVFSNLEQLIGARMTRQVEARLCQEAVASDLPYGVEGCTLVMSNGRQTPLTGWLKHTLGLWLSRTRLSGTSLGNACSTVSSQTRSRWRRPTTNSKDHCSIESAGRRLDRKTRSSSKRTATGDPSR